MWMNIGLNGVCERIQTFHSFKLNEMFEENINDWFDGTNISYYPKMATKLGKP